MVRSGEEIAIEAMEKELAKLNKIAAKAKSECDEVCGAGSELISIHNEFVEIVKSKETGKAVLDRLSNLQRRKKRAKSLLKKSILDLSDKQINAEVEASRLAFSIQEMKFRFGLRDKASKEV